MVQHTTDHFWQAEARSAETRHTRTQSEVFETKASLLPIRGHQAGAPFIP